jgi:hypothetical protein
VTPRTPEPESAKNRLHIDSGSRANPRWTGRSERGSSARRSSVSSPDGATTVREEHYADDAGRQVLGHVVMTDPEGNEFCVA